MAEKWGVPRVGVQLPTEAPAMAAARGPPFWQSRVLRRRYGESPDAAEA